MKGRMVASLLFLSVVFTGCTTVVKAPPPRHRPAKIGCRDVWVPGHNNRHGVWIKGHWEKRCP